MVNNINNFGVINFYESNNSKHETTKKEEPVCEDVELAEDEPQPAKSPKDIWGIPQKGKYNQVREYIEDRKNGDPQFKDFCRRHSLRELCSYLTDEFGWDVDEHSLGANLNRNR